MVIRVFKRNIDTIEIIYRTSIFTLNISFNQTKINVLSFNLLLYVCSRIECMVKLKHMDKKKLEGFRSHTQIFLPS